MSVALVTRHAKCIRRIIYSFLACPALANFSTFTYTVQFPYLETCGVGKYRQTKDKGGAGCEANTSFMARDVSEKCQSKIHRPVDHLANSVSV